MSVDLGHDMSGQLIVAANEVHRAQHGVRAAVAMRAVTNSGRTDGPPTPQGDAVGTTAQFVAGDKGVHRSLAIPSDNVVRWLIDQGVSDAAMLTPWPLKEASVKFVGPHTFDFDDSGEPALIFRATDHDAILDLVAWQARSGRLASWRGVAFTIGDVAEIWNPAHYLFGGALPVHQTPLQWLQAERTGIVVVDHRDAYGYLRSCQRVRVFDPAFGRQLERWVQPPKSLCKIFVEVPERQAA